MEISGVHGSSRNDPYYSILIGFFGDNFDCDILSSVHSEFHFLFFFTINHFQYWMNRLLTFTANLIYLKIKSFPLPRFNP